MVDPVRIDLSHRRLLKIEALKHARAKRPVILLHGIVKGQCTCGDRDCPRAGKHPIAEIAPRGFKNATTDERTIRSWIRDYPEANLAAVPVGYCVFDYDGAEGLALRRKDGLPPTASARTGRGRHDWFLAEHVPTKIRSRPGFDVKGPDGYLVVCPSRHVNGRRYRWVRELHKAIPLPRAARRLIEKSKAKKLDDTDVGDGGVLLEGGRNDGLTRIAGSLRRQGLAPAMIDGVLQAVNERHCDPPLGSSEVEQIAAGMHRYETASDELFGLLAEVQEKVPEFLWYPYIVKGAVTIFEGMPNQGKSFLTMKIAAEVSRGGELPGQGKVEQGRVLVLNPEDHAGYTIRPRLQSMGADLDKVRYGRKLFNFTEDNLSHLQAYIEEHQIKLVTIDPFTAFLGGEVDLYRDNEVRQYMAKLAEIASGSGCSIVVVRHLTKGATNDPINRGSGSIGISASARSVVLIGKDPEDAAMRVMAHVKMNIAASGPSIGFSLAGGDARKGEMPEFIWCGEVDLDAAAVLAGPKREPGRPSDVSDEAKALLTLHLDKGPLVIATANRMAEAKSISARSLRRVAREMGVEQIKLGKENAWRWPAKNLV